jgi:hypothetical protein
MGSFSFNKETDPYFMEPITRRLTTRAYRVPCNSTQLLPTFKNILGQWMIADPNLRRIIYNQTNQTNPDELFSTDEDPHLNTHADFESLFSSFSPCSSDKQSMDCILHVLHYLGCTASIFLLLLLAIKFCVAFILFAEHFCILRSFSGSFKAFYWAFRVPTFLLKKYRDSWKVHLAESRVTIIPKTTTRKERRALRKVKPNSEADKLEALDDLPPPPTHTPTDHDDEEEAVRFIQPTPE